MKPCDISFALSVVLHALVPPTKHTGSMGSKVPHLSSTPGAGGSGGGVDMGRTGSMSSHHTRRTATHPKEIMQTVAFLGIISIPGLVVFNKYLYMRLKWALSSHCSTTSIICKAPK